MPKEFKGTGAPKKHLIYIKGMVVGLLATAACIVLFALIMLFFETGREFAAPFATVSVAAGTFLAALYTSRRIGDKGYLNGLIIGAATFGIVTLASLIISKEGLSLNTLFHFVIIVLSSLMGGILGVNWRKNRKYI